MSEQSVPGRAPFDLLPARRLWLRRPFFHQGHRRLLRGDGVARSRGRGRFGGPRESRFPAEHKNTEVPRVSPSVWSGGSLSTATASAAFRKLSWAPTNSFLEKRCSPRSIIICKGVKAVKQRNEMRLAPCMSPRSTKRAFAWCHSLFALLIARRNTSTLLSAGETRGLQRPQPSPRGGEEWWCFTFPASRPSSTR